MKCTHCGKDILAGGDVQRIPPLEKLFVGLKSGALGLYPHPDHQGEPEETLHHDCCSSFFDPENDPYLREQIMMEIREDAWAEIREELKEEFRSKFQSRNPTRYCIDCWEELECDGQEPNCEPMCLWCKTSEHVWEKATPQGVIYCCTRCSRYWNDDEDELTR